MPRGVPPWSQGGSPPPAPLDASRRTSLGDTRHPDHPDFLRALGEATFASIRLAGICFDLLRIFDGQPSESLYLDPLGKLREKVNALLANRPNLPGLAAFAADLEQANITRNDLIHALPVKDGLYRTRKDGTIRTFYDVADVEAARDEFNILWSTGNQLLYHDGGASIEAWYKTGGS